jgi:hypothetical protein
LRERERGREVERETFIGHVYITKDTSRIGETETEDGTCCAGAGRRAILREEKQGK